MVPFIKKVISTFISVWSLVPFTHEHCFTWFWRVTFVLLEIWSRSNNRLCIYFKQGSKMNKVGLWNKNTIRRPYPESPYMRTLKWLHGNSITDSHSVDWLLFKVPQRARKTSSATFGIHMIYKYKNIKHCKGNIASWFHEDIVNVKFYLTRISEIFEQSKLQENRIRFTVRPLLHSV